MLLNNPLFHVVCFVFITHSHKILRCCLGYVMHKYYPYLGYIRKEKSYVLWYDENWIHSLYKIHIPAFSSDWI